MDTINKYSDIIEQAVKSLQLPADRLPGLYEPIAYGLDTGGKTPPPRSRPYSVPGLLRHTRPGHTGRTGSRNVSQLHTAA